MIVRKILTLTISSLVAAAPLMANGQEPTYQEPFRPQFHYTPAQGWMNDPNGLVYFRGEYHLFYQHNAEATVFPRPGDMSWGHAVSRDLVHWEELPVALQGNDGEWFFSGSAVIDTNNTTGFGTRGNPPMVAIYTSFEPPGTGAPEFRQSQALAYSLDRGRTFNLFPGNPVLDIGSTEFRDPKVFWFEPEDGSPGYWVMLVALSVERKIQVYRSDDLKDWTFLSDFGPANAVGGVWEVPDLIKLPVDGDPNNTKWLMVLNINPGAIAGGSGAQYFIGDFDGTTFTAENVVDPPVPSGNLFEDFEDETYDPWTVLNQPGDLAFGSGPFPGTVPGQQVVTNFLGDKLVNSFLGFDGPIGQLTSPTFTIQQMFINFLIGGGFHPHDPEAFPPIPFDGELLFGFDVPAGTTFEDLGWTATGGLANREPAGGSLAGQGPVTGFVGTGLVNTFYDFDATTGTLTSPEFTIEHDFINLLVGGGEHSNDSPNPAAVNLIVGGSVMRTETGRNSESLDWRTWEVSGLQGQTAQIQIVDQNAGGFGHILADHFIASDRPAGLPPGTVVFDFEFDTTFEAQGWTAEGGLANRVPAAGALPGQQPVTGFLGERLVNTFYEFDSTTGRLLSPPFTITNDFVNLLVGGGNHPRDSATPAAVSLLVNGQVVRTATGQNSEALRGVAWDVNEFMGQSAQIEILDQNEGGFGHLDVDHVTLSDQPVPPRSTETTVNLLVGGEVVRTATGQNSEALDWQAWDVAEFIGQEAQIQVNDFNTGGFGHINADHILFSDEAAPGRLAAFDWIDYGRDFYAVISWENVPGDRPVWIGWNNNWQYAGNIPTGVWRGAQALPREFGLKTIDGEIELVQKPIAALRRLRRGPVLHTGNRIIQEGATLLTGNGASGRALEILAEFELGTASRFGLKVRVGDGEETVIGYDAQAEELFVDRTQSGQTDFNPLFASIERAPLSADDGRIRLHVFVDWSSVEVFANDGHRVITDRIFPSPESEGVALFAEDGAATLKSLRIYQMRSIWQ